MQKWKDSARLGFSRIVDSYSDEESSGVLHVRVRMDEGQVEVFDLQRDQAVPPIQRLGECLEQLIGVFLGDEMPPEARLYQLVIIAPDGEESIAKPCMEERDALAWAESYNFVGPRSGHICEVREYSSHLARDTNGKLHRLLCV